MLIKCPDCRRNISTDIGRCPSCGCIIDDNKVYQQVIIKGWSPLGIASGILTMVGLFITLFLNAIVIGLFDLTDESINDGVFFLAMFCAWNLIPIIQITLGTISLVKRKDAHKWPAIIGIAGGTLGILLFVVIMLLSFL